MLADGGQCIAALTLVVIPSEIVPPQFHATAIGLATLVGELMGGTLAPAISGAVADKHGLGASLRIAAGGAVVTAFAGFLMRETEPSKVSATVQ